VPIKNNLAVTGAASVTAVGVGQRIEQLNSYDLAGSTATLSVNISNTLLTTVTWTASYATSADTWSSKTQIATGTFTVTSSLVNYTANISIPSAATTGIEILFTVGAQISGTWTIGNVQLEAGSTASPFEYRSYGAELALCQRYYLQLNNVSTDSLSQTGACPNTTSGYCGVCFPVQMRSVPTFNYTSLSNIQAYTFGGSNGTISTLTLNAASPTGAFLSVTFSTTVTQFIGFYLRGTGASSSIQFSAEL
jgi:hypothetical protein